LDAGIFSFAGLVVSFFLTLIQQKAFVFLGNCQETTIQQREDTCCMQGPDQVLQEVAG
jgi:hypothetical protein